MAAAQAEQRRRPEQLGARRARRRSSASSRSRRRPRPGPEATIANEVAERRVAELAAPLELLREEAARRRAAPRSAIGVASGWNVCTITRPGASRPLRPASCVTSWNVRSSARKSGSAEAGVGVDDRRERDAGEVVALRDHLRAEQHGAVGRGEAVERLARARRASRPRRRRAGSARARARASRARARAAACRRRSARARASRTPGRPRAPPPSGRSGGSGAARRRAGRARRRSCGQRRVAPQARQWIAGATPRRLRSRIALPPLLGDRAELREQRRRERVARPRGGGRRRGRAAAARRAGRRARAARAAPSSRGAASRCRRRRPRPRARRASPRRCARRSAGRTPACRTASCSSSTQIRPRRGTGAKTAERAPTTTRRLAARDALALVAPLGVGQPRVEDGDAVAEARAEAAERLRRQRDLRHEHDRAAPALERRRAGLEVDLGLAAAGRAGEQEVPPPPSSAPTIRATRPLLRRPSARARLGLAGHASRAAASAARRAGSRLRRDERERPRRRRAVVVGEPEREVDERGRQLVERRPRSAPARRPAGALAAGLDDDAALPRRGRSGRDHGALPDPLRHLVGEGRATRAGGRAGRRRRAPAAQRRGAARWPRPVGWPCKVALTD